MPDTKLTIVTATTPNRINDATRTMNEVALQKTGMDGVVQHLVAIDGIGPETPVLHERAKFYAADCINLLPGPHNDYGAHAKQLGLEHAVGEWVMFWDDDNSHSRDAIETALKTCDPSLDLILFRVIQFDRLHGQPRMLPRLDKEGRVEPGHVDTMCVLVRTSFARQESWVDRLTGTSPGTDYRYLRRLQGHAPRTLASEFVIGTHLS